MRVLGQRAATARKRAALEDVRKRIGFIFQQHNLLGALTASQNVQLGLRVTGRARACRAATQGRRDAGGGRPRRAHRTSARSSCPAGSGSAWRLRARWSASRRWCWRTSPPRRSTRPRAARWSTACSRWRGSGARPSCWSRTTTASSTSPTASCTSKTASSSTFTDAVIANTQQMMHLLAAEHRPAAPRAAGRRAWTRRRSAARCRSSRSSRSGSSRRPRWRATRPTRACSSSRCASLRAGSASCSMPSARRCSWWTASGSSWCCAWRRTCREGDYVRIPLGERHRRRGRAVRRGRCASTTPTPIRASTRRSTAETGFRTRSMLCLPLQDRSGAVFAVTQLLNRRDGRPFDEQDTRRYAEFASSLSVLLESLVKLGGQRRGVAMIGSPSRLPVRLLQVTDPHLFGDESRTIYGVTTAVSLRKVLAEAFAPGTPRPDCDSRHRRHRRRPQRRRVRRISAARCGRTACRCSACPAITMSPASWLTQPASDGDGFQYGGTAEFGAWGAVFIDTHVPGRPEGGVAPQELSRLEVGAAGLRRPADPGVPASSAVARRQRVARWRGPAQCQLSSWP